MSRELPGHPGSLCTVHSPGGGLATIHRIARAAMRNTAAMPYPALLEEIRAALDLVVFLARDERGRRGVFGIDAIRADGVSPVFVRETDGIRLVAQA